MDPRKLKVNELKEQLQLAGLSVNGKKEELVARLLEHQKAEEEAVNAAGPPTGTGDSFEWDESKFDVDDLAPPSDPVTSAPTAPAKTNIAEPAEKPAAATSTTESTNSITSSSPKSANPAASSTTASTAGTVASNTGIEAVQFQGGVKDAETLKAEYEKRKNRAARFGIPLKEQDKAVERAARFGVPVPATVTASLAKTTGTPATTTTSPKPLPTKPGSVAAQIPEDILSKRRERFGIQAPTTTATSQTGAAVGNAKKPALVLDEAEEEKKRKRAAKFGAASAPEDASKKLKV
ncbi:hypothetical protein EDD21DRAFT_405625 [Dissophora ornata]|nr:hypothetical protein BGZ58_006498 [Dissophora ornata]KAI8599955.1 hypothetical protein EDD21DRAFT_405625 [Dissophora ornata]